MTGRLVASAAVLAVLVSGCGDPTGAVVEWRQPQLQQLDRLMLRYRGPARGAFVVEFVHPTGTAAAEQELETIDLGRGRRLSQENYGVELPLRPPLTEPVMVRVQPVEGGRGEVVSFTVDPTREVDELLGPVDRLQGGRLKEFCTDVAKIRGAYGKAVTADGLTAFIELRRALAEVLERYGLTRDVVAGLRRIVDGAKGGRLAPGGPLTARLLPLRMVEALLCEPFGPFCPWGLVAAAIDMEVVPVQDWTLPPGWTAMGRWDFRKPMPAPNVPELTVGGWQWMATAYMVRELRKDGAVKLVYTNFVNSQEDVLGRPEDYTSRLTAVLQAPEGGGTVELPPAEARLCLVMRALTRETVLRVQLNDGPEMVVLNSMFNVVGQPDLGEYDPCLYRLGIDPELVRPTGNTVTLTMEAMPHQEPPLALRLKEVALQIR